MREEMKDFYGMLIMDFKRAFIGIRFIGIVLSISVLWYINSRRFAILPQQDVLNVFYSSEGWSTVREITMTACGAVFGLSVCEDFQDREWVYILNRVSRLSYIVSKLVNCFLATTVTYMTGTGIYLICELTQMPLVIANGARMESIRNGATFGYLLPEHTLTYIGTQTFLTGLLCSCMAVAAMALSAYVKDGFIVLCFPVVLSFLLLIMTNNILHIPEIDPEEVFWIITCVRPEKVFWINVIIFTIFTYTLAGVLLYKGIARRCRHE